MFFEGRKIFEKGVFFLKTPSLYKIKNKNIPPNVPISKKWRKQNDTYQER